MSSSAFGELVCTRAAETDRQSVLRTFRPFTRQRAGRRAAAAVSSEVPFSGDDTSMMATPIPRPRACPRRGVQASWRIVTGDYFRTLQVSFRQGRLFAPRGEPQA